MTEIWTRANAQLKDLVAYEPGKPVDEVARELGLDPSEIVKLASNENPLGPSPRAVEAMHAALAQAQLYPDGGGYRLRTAIAEKFGLGRENIVLGNGSNEIIEFVGHAFLQPGDEVITAAHAFVVYKLMATLFGAETVEVADPGFKHDLDAMAAAITPRTKEIFIANCQSNQQEYLQFTTDWDDSVQDRRNGLDYAMFSPLLIKVGEEAMQVVEKMFPAFKNDSDCTICVGELQIGVNLEL